MEYSFLASTFVILNVVSFLMYGYDKFLAVRGKSRVSERALIICSLLGGWLGALLAMKIVRHKTSKLSFLIKFWVSVFFNILLLCALGYFCWWK